MSRAPTRRGLLTGSAAAALGLAAGAAPTTAAPALSASDASLVAMATELRAIISAQTALIKDDPRDCDDVPGYLPLEHRLFEIADALFEVSPDGLPGVVAAADIVQQLADNVGGDEFRAGHGHNLACDVLRIIGGRADA